MHFGLALLPAGLFSPGLGCFARHSTGREPSCSTEMNVLPSISLKLVKAGTLVWQPLPSRYGGVYAPTCFHGAKDRKRAGFISRRPHHSLPGV